MGGLGRGADRLVDRAGRGVVAAVEPVLDRKHQRLGLLEVLHRNVAVHLLPPPQRQSTAPDTPGEKLGVKHQGRGRDHGGAGRGQRRRRLGPTSGPRHRSALGPRRQRRCRSAGRPSRSVACQCPPHHPRRSSRGSLVGAAAAAAANAGGVQRQQEQLDDPVSGQQARGGVRYQPARPSPGPRRYRSRSRPGGQRRGCVRPGRPAPRSTRRASPCSQPRHARSRDRPGSGWSGGEEGGDGGGAPAARC